MDGIKYELEKDIQLIKAIAKCGIITENLLHMLDIDVRRLRKHIYSNNIEKKGTVMLFGRMTNIYMLTNKSKKRVSSDFLINPYKTDLSQIEHDYALLKVYLFLNSKEKESWLTETRLHIDFPASTKTVDGMYITGNNKRIGVEVITDSYTDDDINAKKDFIRAYCDDYIMIHASRDTEYTV
jgi:hypothetical protein